MKRKEDRTAAHELRDHPVPPVKGAVMAEEELGHRPESRLTGRQEMGDAGAMDNWL